MEIAAAREHEVEPKPAKLPCKTRGEMRLRGSVKVFAHRDGEGAFAHFAHRTVALSVVDVPSTVADRMVLQAGDRQGFVLEGWLDRNELAFATAKKISLADTAWIAQGARVSIKLGAGDKLVVAPISTTLESTDTLVDCEDVAIGSVERDFYEPEGRSGSSYYTMASDRLAIAPAPDAPATFTLHRKKGARIVLGVDETAAGLHLSYSDGITVDGWVQRSELAPLPGFSGSWGCAGTGGIGIAALAAGTRLARARKTTTIVVDGTPRGSLHRDGEVLLLEIKGDRARILPRCRDMLPEEGSAFWVRAADLEPGPSAPHLRDLMASCR